MTRITQLENRGAAVAWSPIGTHADFIALGAKDSAGIGFEDTGGDLELCDLNLTCPEGPSPSPRIVGKVKTPSRFASIGWTPGSEAVAQRYPLGLIAGGMVDGTVHVWNAQAILENKDGALLATIQKHAGGAVKALQFSSLSPTMMATGGSDGQVLITNLDNPRNPVVTMPGTEPSKGAEVTKVAWNTQVAHIVAAAAGDGSVTIWDLNAKKPWCRVQAESAGIPITDLQWNPTQGLHLVTASGNDSNPVLKLWDLRASTSMPLATLSGHTQGVLGLAWCPHDDTLLISCGKDNRTILWDLFTLQPIADIPNEEAEKQALDIQKSSSAELFSGSLSSSQQKRYDVQWSPWKRGVVSTCSFDRKVQAHSVIGLATRSGRPPKWLAPSSGVSYAFGGAFVSFSANNKVVSVRTVVEEPELVAASNEFEAEMAKGETITFCQSMAAKARRKGDPSDAEVWGFMQVIFEANARQQLLEHLGFHADTIEKVALEFDEDIVKGVQNMSVDDRSTAPMSKKTEDAVKAALLVGNFGAAVECCFRTGNLADALVLASCGGAELWSKTQERYFEMEAKKRPFLSIVSAVIHNKLEELVAASRPSRWQETLAILSTYGQSEEFPSLCIALGDRLESVGDFRNASLCYMCSLSLDKAVTHWKTQFEARNKAKGKLDLLALHDFVVKVTVYMKAMDASVTMNEDVAAIFTQYASALAEQGLLVTAAKYCRGTSPESKILRDRLYRSRESPGCLAALGSAPEFPFSLVQVNKAPAGSAASSRASQRRQQQSYASQQQSYSNQQAVSQGGVVSQNQAAYGAQQAQTTSVSPALPEGWVALQDPSSGRTYYANTTTGQSTWELPQPVAVAPAVAPQAPVQPSYPSANGTANQPASAQSQTHLQQQQQPTTNTPANGGSRSATPSRLAKKYGDGFVTSSSHPELGEQYGNIGTSNPYPGERHGIAQVAPTGKAPVSGTFDPNAALDLLAEHEHIKDTLVELAASLNAAQLTPADKRQLSEAEKGIAVLLKRLARGDIDAEISGKVDAMVSAIRSRDYTTAAMIQTGLVNSDWKDHKDWLKGLKFLILLATKKIN